MKLGSRLSRIAKMWKIITLLLVFSMSFFVFTGNSQIFADELTELNNKIQEKQKEKNDTIERIKKIEQDIQNLEINTSNISQTKTYLESQKLELEQEMQNLEQQIQEQEKLLSDYKGLLESTKEDIVVNTNLLVKMKYSSTSEIFSEENKLEDIIVDSQKNSFVVDLYEDQVQSYRLEIQKIESVLNKISAEREETSQIQASTIQQIADIEVQIKNNMNTISQAQGSKKQYESKLNEIDSQLKFMSQRQQELLQAELAKINANQQAVQTEIKSGEYFFMGRGRDLVEGHGLGMSQWGAYGMAQKGWTYDQILKHYYAGVEIADYNEPDQIHVTGKYSDYPEAAQKRGYLTMDEYLSGIGEVPNNWPAEAIKAQIVAARTYVMGTCGNRTSCEICATAACQVYLGGEDKNKFVQETKGKVILHGGQPIVAYYSASHRGHSSSMSTVWGAADKPYIQPVSDDAYAFKSYKTCNPYIYPSIWGCSSDKMIETYNWQWRTNGYDLEDLTTIFSNHSGLNVGEVQSITVQKDVAGRVSLITLEGTTGTKSMTGWDFKAMFNVATPFNDYIYSTEFTFNQKA